MPKPSLGRTVHYRSNSGLQTMRAAIVTATVDTLDPRGVDSGDVPALDSERNVHLWVYSPSPNSPAGGFHEFNIPLGHVDERSGEIPPGSWTWPTTTHEET